MTALVRRGAVFGISGAEFVVLLVIAALVLGPRNVAQAVGGVRRMIAKGKEFSARLRAETTIDVTTLGLDPADIEAIKSFSAQSFDPRAMVREAVREEMQAWAQATSSLSSIDSAPKTAAAKEPQPSGLPEPTKPDQIAPDAQKPADNEGEPK